jgi:hypothetical protein
MLGAIITRFQYIILLGEIWLMCARVCSVQVPTLSHLAEKSAKLVFGRQAFHCFVWLEAIFA